MAPVQLYIYDLSHGTAAALSPALLGRPIDGVWHTSVVVHGLEHYYGGGINRAPAGSTPFGRPTRVLDLGQTELDEEIIEVLLVELAQRYTPEAYSLFDNNCNNFSDELARLLTGGDGVPPAITGLPAAVLETPFGQLIRPMLAGLEAQMRSMRGQAFHAVPPGDVTAVPAPPEAAAAREIAPSPTPMVVEPVQQGDGEGPALLAAEHELEAAVAEAACLDMEQRLEELDLKEGRATPVQQLGEEGAVRLAAEATVKRELDRLLAEGVEPKEAEALAVEHVAASGKLPASPTSPRPKRHSRAPSLDGGAGGSG